MSTETPQHVVSVVVAGRELRGWQSYDVTVSMTEVPGTFRMSLPFTRDAWDICRPDRPMRILLDGVAILTGFVDDEEAPDDLLEINGRCRLGRMVDESAPALRFESRDLKSLAVALADPWFGRVSLSNARNRTLVRGSGHKAVAAGEPVVVASRSETNIEVGQTRWTALEGLIQQIGLLAWSSGDGQELVIAPPNYNQEPQFRFFRPSFDSQRRSEANVMELTPRRSTGDRYSRITVVGSGEGSVGEEHYGFVLNNPANRDGVGTDFSAPKRLIIPLDVESSGKAKQQAEREMARRDAQGDVITVKAPGHGQIAGGFVRTLFAPDLLAHVEDERTGTVGAYLITSCNYRSDRRQGEHTMLTLVRKGARLAR